MPPIPPSPKKIPYQLLQHGDQRNDPYHWLCDKDHPEVLEYLKRENDYVDAWLQGSVPSRDELFRELRSHIPPQERSAGFHYGPYHYYSEITAQEQYRRYYRQPRGSLSATLILDLNQEALGLDYLDLGAWEPTRDGTLLAYSLDQHGDEVYTIRVKSLRTNELLPDCIDGTDGHVVWTNDQTAFYYVQLNELHRPVRVFYHLLGTSVADDVLVYEEKDPQFFVHCYKTRSHEHMVIESFGNNTSEAHVAPAQQACRNFRCIKPRQPQVEYNLEHHGECFYLLTNADDAVNFKVMQLATDAKAWTSWREFIPHHPDRYLTELACFDQFFALNVRCLGVATIDILDPMGKPLTKVAPSEEAYTLELGSNPESNQQELQYHFSSLTTPDAVYRFNPLNRQTTLLQQDQLGIPYEPRDYQSRRLYAPTQDGSRVPISLVYQKGLVTPHHPAPTIIFGYGAYGAAYDPSFAAFRLALLNRGFIVAIAHVRGGSELGRTWYEGGKLFDKKQTFADFKACSEFLIAEGWSLSGHVFAEGGSAGGLLMGVLANECPELFRGIIAQVPFVDVLTTMLDPSLPLTTIEYNEWGNPNDEAIYHYIKSYSPYDNVIRQAYPAMYVTAGLNDPRVTYWEPAKWVAKLRDQQTTAQPILLRTQMGAGHGGASARDEALREQAELLAFVLKVNAG